MRVLAGSAAGLLLAACGGPAPAPPAPVPLTVFAAASLTAAFNAEAAAFERSNRVEVKFSYAGSNTLAGQIVQGAPADVFASADQPNMATVSGAGLADGSPQVFARNRLEIVVAPGNPKQVTGLVDLARSDVAYISAAPSVPAGRYAAQALAAAGVAARPRSLEADVKGVVTKVALGEADAGIVYVTDVGAAGRTVSGVPIPDGQNVIASYPVVALRSSAHPAQARAFVAFLLGAQGQAILAGQGFSPR